MAIYYTRSSGPDPEAAKRALAKLFSLAPGLTVGILAHTKNNLDAFAIEGVLGQKAIDTLKQKGSVTIGDRTIVLLTDKKMPSTLNYPVLAAYISPDALSKLLARPSISDIVYLPWTPDEMTAAASEGWKET